MQMWNAARIHSNITFDTQYKCLERETRSYALYIWFLRCERRFLHKEILNGLLFLLENSCNWNDLMLITLKCFWAKFWTLKSSYNFCNIAKLQAQTTAFVLVFLLIVQNQTHSVYSRMLSFKPCFHVQKPARNSSSYTCTWLLLY